MLCTLKTTDGTLLTVCYYPGTTLRVLVFLQGIKLGMGCCDTLALVLVNWVQHSESERDGG